VKLILLSKLQLEYQKCKKKVRKNFGTKNEHGKFLDDMNCGIYIKYDTLEDRIKTHIYTIQRNSGAALVHEKGGFL
jgi:hypothetical protein